MPNKTQPTGVIWNPPLRSGKIAGKTRPTWTISVRNDGDARVGSQVVLSVFVPLVGAKLENQVRQGSTADTDKGQENNTQPLETNYTGAVPGDSPYDIAATPIGGGVTGTISSVVLVAATRVTV